MLLHYQKFQIKIILIFVLIQDLKLWFCSLLTRLKNQSVFFCLMFYNSYKLYFFIKTNLFVVFQSFNVIHRFDLAY